MVTAYRYTANGVRGVDLTSQISLLSRSSAVLLFSRRAADLLPVVLLIDVGPQGATGLMLNRRTGVLMGDLGDDFKSFMIQVWCTVLSFHRKPPPRCRRGRVCVCAGGLSHPAVVGVLRRLYFCM